MPSVLNIATSGLLAFQKGLATTGHNIANASTEGYSRQEVRFGTRGGSPGEGGYVGDGVETTEVLRGYDAYLAKEYRNSTSAYHQFGVYSTMADRLDNLVAEQDRGLASQFERFFAAMQDVSNNPSSIPERQVFLGEASALAAQFRYLDDSLEALNDQVNEQLELMIDEINSIAIGITNLNEDISNAKAVVAGQDPNDLLDQRDKLLLSLGEKIGLVTSEQNDGVMNVIIGNGQPLVVGNRAESLSVGIGSIDPVHKEILFNRVNGGQTEVTDYLTGGAVQGLLNFRDGILNGARQQLGLLAMGVVETFNAQHRLGVDLNGVAGGDVFDPITVKVAENYKNAGSSSITAVVNDVSQVQPTDYRAYYDGTNWQLTNLLSGAVTQGAGPFDLDGLSIDISGVAIEGDEFLIRPNFRSASLVDMAMSAPADLAAAAPLKSADALTNTGSGTLASVAVTSTQDLPLVADITFTFNPDAGGAGVPGFNVTGGPGGVLLYDPATDFSGKTLTLAGYGDPSFVMSGVPETNDTFTLSGNAGGAGDNRNAMLLAGLQTKTTLLKSTASYQDMFATTVSDIGIQTRQSQQSLATQTVLNNQAEGAHKAKSGVNLDEEAANLLRYQQSYQAAAKVITVADEMFQALLNAFR